MKLRTSITISRWSDGELHIVLDDEASGIRFADIEIRPKEFAEALTGLGNQDCTTEVRGLEYVGKVRVTERRLVVCPLVGHRREEMKKWLEENCQEEGWLLNSYLGSHDSVVRKDGATVLNYSVTKYVDPASKEEAAAYVPSANTLTTTTLS